MHMHMHMQKHTHTHTLARLRPSTGAVILVATVAEQGVAGGRGPFRTEYVAISNAKRYVQATEMNLFGMFQG